MPACRLPISLGVAAAFFLTASLQASDYSWKNIQFGGSFSQGYLKSTENNYPVDTKGGTFDFREESLNASTTFGTHLRLAAQVYAEKLGKFGGDRPLLDWAILDYNFSPEFGVKVGRLKYPRSLYSDVLDLDMVRPFIFLPQSIYDSRLRDFQSSFDGGMVYGSVSVGQNSFDYKVFYGDIPMKTNSGAGDYFNNTSLFANPPGVKSLRMDSVRGAALNWNTPVAGLRFGLSYSYYTNLTAVGPFVAVPSFPLTANLGKFEYNGASAEYTRGPWTFAGEYLLVKSSSLITFPSFIGPPSVGKYGTKACYVSVARRLGTKFEVGTYYSEGNNSYPAGASAVNHRRDWTLAVRYDVNDHLLFKVEAHAINGTMEIFNVPGISNPAGSLKDSMTLFAAKTTLSF